LQRERERERERSDHILWATKCVLCVCVCFPHTHTDTDTDTASLFCWCCLPMISHSWLHRSRFLSSPNRGTGQKNKSVGEREITQIPWFSYFSNSFLFRRLFFSPKKEKQQK
jgi:hypothetical protein